MFNFFQKKTKNLLRKDKFTRQCENKIIQIIEDVKSDKNNIYIYRVLLELVYADLDFLALKYISFVREDNDNYNRDSFYNYMCWHYLGQQKIKEFKKTIVNIKNTKFIEQLNNEYLKTTKTKKEIKSNNEKSSINKHQFTNFKELPSKKEILSFFNSNPSEDEVKQFVEINIFEINKIRKNPKILVNNLFKNLTLCLIEVNKLSYALYIIDLTPVSSDKWLSMLYFSLKLSENDWQKAVDYTKKIKENRMKAYTKCRIAEHIVDYNHYSDSIEIVKSLSDNYLERKSASIVKIIEKLLLKNKFNESKNIINNLDFNMYSDDLIKTTSLISYISLNYKKKKLNFEFENLFEESVPENKIKYICSELIIHLNHLGIKDSLKMSRYFNSTHSRYGETFFVEIKKTMHNKV